MSAPIDPPWLTDLLRVEVHQRVEQDPRTLETPGTYLGWPQDRVFADVVGGGQADFSAGVGHLDAHDRALLYAKFNMRRHLDELREAFQQLFKSASLAGSPTVLDLGCGPFTAGLALASAVGPTRKFRYFGIDRATAMCELGQRLFEAARERGALYATTTCQFGSDLDAIDFGPPRNDLTLVVASYLLASPTIVVQDLVESIAHAARRIGPGPVAVLYTNSAKDGPNKKYKAFRDGLVAAGFELKQDAVERFTRTRNPADLRYALLFRDAEPGIRLDEATP